MKRKRVIYAKIICALRRHLNRKELRFTKVIPQSTESFPGVVFLVLQEAYVIISKSMMYAQLIIRKLFHLSVPL